LPDTPYHGKPKVNQEFFAKANDGTWNKIVRVHPMRQPYIKNQQGIKETRSDTTPDHILKPGIDDLILTDTPSKPGTHGQVQTYDVRQQRYGDRWRYSNPQHSSLSCSLQDALFPPELVGCTTLTTFFYQDGRLSTARNEFICWPFALSKSGRVPAEIIEKLQIDGFRSVVVMYDQPPLCSMVQLA
jgi:hypothetical protein